MKSEKQINDVDDYVGYAIDLWESFLESFTRENGLIRRQRFADGERLFELAKEYKVTSNAIADIVYGVSWKHV